MEQLHLCPVLYLHEPDLDSLVWLLGLAFDLPHHCRLADQSLDLILTQICCYISCLFHSEVTAPTCTIVTLSSWITLQSRATLIFRRRTRMRIFSCDFYTHLNVFLKVTCSQFINQSAHYFQFLSVKQQFN